MKSFYKQFKFGKPLERPVAEVAASLLFPQVVELRLVRLPEQSHIDFLVVDGDRVIAALEIKCRTFNSRRFKRTILPATVAEQAEAFSLMGIPTYAAVLFTDGLLILDVLAQNRTPINITNRYGKERAHFEYDVPAVLRVKIEAEKGQEDVRQRSE